MGSKMVGLVGSGTSLVAVAVTKAPVMAPVLKVMDPLPSRSVVTLLSHVLLTFPEAGRILLGAGEELDDEGLPRGAP